MNRLLNICVFASQDLNRNRALFFYNAFVLLLIAFLVGGAVSFSSSLSNESRTLSASMPQVWVQQLQAGRMVGLPDSIRTDVLSMRGIQAVWPRLWGYHADEVSNAVFCLMSLDSLQEAWPYIRLLPNSSALLQDSTCLVGKGFLQASGLELGDYLSLPDYKKNKKAFKIIGAFDAEADIFTKNTIFLSANSLRLLWNWPDSLHTDLGVKLYNDLEANNFAKKIAERYPSVRVFTSEALKSSYTAIWGWRGGVVIYGVLPALLCFLVLAWGRISNSSKQEFYGTALLKGLGWSIRDVMLLKLLQHGYVATLSVGLGLLLAYLHNTYFNAALLRPILVGRSSVYPDFDIEFSMGLGDIAVVLCFTLLPYLMVCVVPVWRLAVLSPAEALRSGQ
ncbi:MAG: FtsX-like permease family protein [Cytophagales bacterium]|nr:MAG: FtsX-like permease family protein [Cytophagales bacterium]